MGSATAQPTVRREPRSMTTARYNQPSPVQTLVMYPAYRFPRTELLGSAHTPEPQHPQLSSKLGDQDTSKGAPEARPLWPGSRRARPLWRGS